MSECSLNRRSWLQLLLSASAGLPLARGKAAQALEKAHHPSLDWFFAAGSDDRAEAEAALAHLAARWKDGYVALLVDLLQLIQKRQNSEAVLMRLVRFLEKRTGERYGLDITRWRKWSWTRPYEPHPEYARFKGLLYRSIDPKMEQFFPPTVPVLVRLDEIEWGGVRVNGIPPLVYPAHLRAHAADYLKDSHLVFGVAFEGQYRAYPKRVLGWHEMAIDRLGDFEFTLVYCTLCGTAIPYSSEVGGRLRRFGTSGLLYRSNKLMFDEQTNSLWSTLEGRPVVGSLAVTDLRLQSYPIVTTTWREWRQTHPETTVLTLETGFERDYSEGAAYRDYFATDELMFPVALQDKRLRNKEEVLVLRIATAGSDPVPVAIAVKLLAKNPVFHFEINSINLVVLTSRRQANRVYKAENHEFVAFDGQRATDKAGLEWTVTEESLLAPDSSKSSLPRVAAQRAFWFGWFAQFPQTMLFRD